MDPGLPHAPQMPQNPEPAPTTRSLPLANRYLLGLLTVSGVFGVLYWILVRVEGLTSASMFVGIPVILGWLIGLMPLKNTVAAAAQYTTLILCIIAPLVGEGVICILMAAPIVYPIVLVVAFLVKSSHDKARSKLGAVVVMMPYLFGILQPVDPAKTSDEFIYNSVLIAAPPEIVWNTLEDLDLRISDNRPWLLRLGYPVPMRISSKGMNRGDRRLIEFNNGTISAHVSQVVPYKSMTLDLSIQDSHGEFFDRWVDLSEMQFHLVRVGTTHTLLIHSAKYKPKLALRWYFAKIEKFTSRLLEEYLLGEFANHVSTLERQVRLD